MARLYPMLTLLLLLQLLILQTPLVSSVEFEAPRLARCPPSGNLTLTLPEDLPVGSVLFSWDPAQLALKSSHHQYKKMMNRALSQYSLSTRAFFSDGIEDKYLVVPAASHTVLTAPLPAGGPNLLRGRFHIRCSPKAETASAQQFTLNIRLVRRRLRLTLDPARPVVSRWSRPGVVLANVRVFASGRRLAPAACAVTGAPAGAELSVDAATGRVTLTAPLQPPAADDLEWTSASVACDLPDGRRIRTGLPVAPYQLWRRPLTRLTVSAPGDALTGGQLILDLGALLVRRGPRVRLLRDGGGSARLGSGPRPLLLLNLPSPGGRSGVSLLVTLEAVDAQGRSEPASLRVDVAAAADAVEERVERRWPRWWPAAALAGTVGAAACLVAAAVAAVCGLRRRFRYSRVVKPQFV